MPHEILQKPEVVTHIADRMTRAVALHMWPNPAEPRPLSRFADEVIDRLPRHGLAALGYEQPRQMVFSRT
jgi:hypothetical protein